MMLNGIYDETATQSRSAYKDGVITGFIQRRVIGQSGILCKAHLNDAWTKPWGYYPDNPTDTKPTTSLPSDLPTKPSP